VPTGRRRVTRKERRLARALLLCATMHLLRQERQHCLDMKNYEGAKWWDRKIRKRQQRYLDILEDYYL
jgi:hypothetical protein